ncbi:Crp/Fnr family transcriptional regulator [uncultured Croceitalea sp.]|uniref:Crp/Fnr family transcriptional regulator n=1 Tax=uncultured Croceitalea sp. TaxID=1798908 RepID=UPI003305705A
MKSDFLNKCYPDFEIELLKEIEEHAILKKFESGEYIVQQGQYIKFLPIIRSGCVKVFCNEEAKDFLLYFIESGESCIYSFAHLNNNERANFSASAELESDLLLLPIARVKIWMKKYPSLNNIVLNNYKKHYEDLLYTTKQIISSNLEDRLLAYLRTKSKIANSRLLNISHKNIADDLGTSREVVSRLMKSKRLIQNIKQEGHRIKIL